MYTRARARTHTHTHIVLQELDRRERVNQCLSLHDLRNNYLILWDRYHNNNKNKNNICMYICMYVYIYCHGYIIMDIFLLIPGVCLQH